MSRVLVLGMGPLPFENTPKTFGPGIRAWQFIEPLLAEGHEVVLAAQRIPFIYPEDTPPLLEIEAPGFIYHSMDRSVFEDGKTLAGIRRRFGPDVLLAATIFASAPLDDPEIEQPVWIDQFGHVMAEAQAKAFRYDSDRYLQHFFGYQTRSLQHTQLFGDCRPHRLG